MNHKPMTYISRIYCLENEPTQYAVFFCTKDGKRMVQAFDTARQLKAFTTALDGLGFTKKRR